MGHRYYDPGTGRFLTRDPLGYGGGVNLYGFTGNNPVNMADPWGLAPPDRLPEGETGSTLGDALLRGDFIEPEEIREMGEALREEGMGHTGAALEMEEGMNPGGFSARQTRTNLVRLLARPKISPTEPLGGMEDVLDLSGSAFGVPNARGGRLRNQSVRRQNAAIAAELEKRGYSIKNGGGRSADEYLPALNGGRKGGSFIDITARNIRTGRILRVQTVDMNSDGTVNIRELTNAARIRLQKPHDHLLLIPKR